MLPTKSGSFDAVSDHLAKRRPEILQAWRKASEEDPAQRTARALTHGQFADHIPELLDAFELKLRSHPGDAAAANADRDTKAEEVKHGLHRWQQGYRLQELMSEWGHLQLCLFEELHVFAAEHAEFDRAMLAEVNRRMITLVHEAIRESSAQYERMQQAEAASHLGSFQEALDRVNEIERTRATLIHQAVHDISSNVFGVKLAANLLDGAGMAVAEKRAEFTALLHHGVQSVTAMLGELMELARLEAGQEERNVAPFDAAALVVDLCAANQPAARERRLRLDTAGPQRLRVEGDAAKIRRLLQNLVGNALKYTTHGGVMVSWGVEKKSWWLKISDTGPGLSTGGQDALVAVMKEATASARESDVKSAATTGETSRVLSPSPDSSGALARTQSNPGEGIGLSIVKRLCELLDASLEVASSPKTGTTFRIVLPRRY